MFEPLSDMLCGMVLGFMSLARLTAFQRDFELPGTRLRLILLRFSCLLFSTIDLLISFMLSSSCSLFEVLYSFNSLRFLLIRGFNTVWGPDLVV